MGEKSITCPDCGQTMDGPALRCTQCSAGSGRETPVGPRRSPRALPAKRKGPRSWVLPGCLGLFLAGILAIATPGLLASRRSYGERSRSTSLKVIAAAEEEFRKNDLEGRNKNEYWTGDLSRLFYLAAKGEPIKLLDESIALADAAPLVPLPGQQARQGYWYVSMKLDGEGKPYNDGSGYNPAAFAFCGYPASRSDGKYTFIIDENRTIFRNDNGGVAVLRWPRNLAAEGWTKLD